MYINIASHGKSDVSRRSMGVNGTVGRTSIGLFEWGSSGRRLDCLNGIVADVDWIV